MDSAKDITIESFNFKPFTKETKTDIREGISSVEHYLVRERHQELRVNLVLELHKLQIAKFNVDAFYGISVN